MPMPRIHSIGVVLVDGTHPDWPDNKEHSFHLNPAGKVVELYGWGRHGSTRFAPGLNPPAADNYTTVYLSGPLTGRAKAAVLELAGEHRARFGELRVWAAPAGGAVGEWVANGLADPEEVNDAEGGGDQVGDEPEGPDGTEGQPVGEPVEAVDPDAEADGGEDGEAEADGPGEEE